MLERIKESIKKFKETRFGKLYDTYGYLGYFMIALFLIDYELRNEFLIYAVNDLYELVPLLFVLFWISLFTYLAYMIHGKLKKVYMILLVLFFCIYAIGQAMYFNVFSKYFTILDISLLQEGTEFADASYFTVRMNLIFMCLIALSLTVYACFKVPRKKQKYTWKQCYPAALCISLAVSARVALPAVLQSDVWDASTSQGNIYQDYTDTTKSLLLSGIYEYTFRDIYLAYNPFKTLNHAKTISNLDDYFETVEYVHEDNEMTGLLAGKNVMFIQLENIDEWMLTEENMPNLYQLRMNGIDFTNHYATTFATGKTFNTEFIANTGLIPQTKGAAPSYIYSRNSYPYSLANLFKNAGYTTNSFHASNGHVYNRENVHHTFGYRAYHNYALMGMEDSSMDSQMVNGYEQMVSDDPFMDLLITISAHGPFDPELAACSTHLEEVMEYEMSDDMVYMCGLAQAKETDMLIGNLLERLLEDGHINDTALVFYTDHYAYGTIDEETELALKGTNDPNLLSNVAFFIWANDIEPYVYENVTSTVDILPTITNLFGFDVEYKYFIGYDAFDNINHYVFFQDGAVLTNEEYYIPSLFINTEDVSEKMKTYIKEANERLNRSWDILTVDYFAH